MLSIPYTVIAFIQHARYYTTSTSLEVHAEVPAIAEALILPLL